MKDFKTNFAALAPTDWSDVPLDNLSSYMRELFTEIETIINSVPAPVQTEAAPALPDASNTAKGALDTLSSAAPNAIIDVRNVDNQKAWGKPIKLSPKENPLKVAVFKTAAHDRRGAWFGRRSVHQGIGFEKFRNTMQREFPESLEKEDGPGSGAVRGIAADKKIEDRVVADTGRISVWQMSAVFPGPVTPREFTTLLITTENALGSDSADNDGKVPRHFMVVSKPTKHAGSPDRRELVRGTYESVEIIREIPGQADPETNPIEWIMITRSDPGGGIPKFMVERGTPAGIVSDTVKFLDWACAKPDDIEPESPPEPSEVTEEHKPNGAVVADTTTPAANGTPIDPSSKPKPEPIIAKDLSESPPQSAAEPHHEGILATIQDRLQDRIAGYLPHFQGLHLEKMATADNDDTTSTSSTSSDLEPFMSAREMSLDDENAPQRGEAFPSLPDETESQLRARAESEASQSKKVTQHQREIAKLDEKRQALDARIAQTREIHEGRIRSLSSLAERVPTSDSEKSANGGATNGKLAKPDKEAKDALAAKAALERHKRTQEKEEDKYTRAVEKLEAKRRKELEKEAAVRDKEERKAEQRLAKLRAKDKEFKHKELTGRLHTERDEMKARLDVVDKENAILREQLERLQKENTFLVKEIAGMEKGSEILRRVKEDRRRSGSGASAKSAGSNSPSRAASRSGSGRALGGVGVAEGERNGSGSRLAKEVEIAELDGGTEEKEGGVKV